MKARWLGAAGLTLLGGVVLLRRPLRWLAGAAWRSLLWLLLLTAAARTGLTAAFGLGVNPINAGVLGVLGLPGLGLLLSARWLLG